jgi:hypothetical protein
MLARDRRGGRADGNFRHIMQPRALVSCCASQ